MADAKPREIRLLPPSRRFDERHVRDNAALTQELAASGLVTRWQQAPPQEGKKGALVDALVVAITTASASVALVDVLRGWLQGRRGRSVVVEIERDGHTIRHEVTTTGDLDELTLSIREDD